MLNADKEFLAQKVAPHRRDGRAGEETGALIAMNKTF